jgi:putative phage-type endonuclease
MSSVEEKIENDEVWPAMEGPVMERKKAEYLARMVVTDAEVKHIMNVEQRTDEWFKARYARMTGSVYGAAAGHNKYSSPKKLLKELLWKSFQGNAATAHGTKYEPVAADLYEKFTRHHSGLKCSFYYPGLVICKDQPWIAGSPDGLPLIGTLRILLEIKCPFYKKSYPFIPHYYFDQIQGIMGLLQLPYCDFFTWTDQRVQLRRFKFDSGYWLKVLFPRLKAFYMDRYLPRLILKEEGFLKKGEVELVSDALELEVEAPEDPMAGFDFVWGGGKVTAAPKAKRQRKK